MHSFDLSPTEAVELQKSFRGRLRHVRLKKPVKYIAGADVSFNKFEEDVYAGIIVLSYPDLKSVEHACIKMKVSFPYIPGLLSFREIPPLLKVWELMKIKPDVVVVDGHGIAHPRRLGIAAHFGLVANVPTIGAAKSRLYGTYKDPGAEKGSQSDIIDPKTDEILGVALRTKQRSLPMFISPGHLITLSESLNLIKKCDAGYRLPEPTRQAHMLVNKFRKHEIEERKTYGKEQSLFE